MKQTARSASVSRPTSRTASATSRWCTEAQRLGPPSRSDLRPAQRVVGALAAGHGSARARRPGRGPSSGVPAVRSRVLLWMSRVTRPSLRVDDLVSRGCVSCSAASPRPDVRAPRPALRPTGNRFWKLLDAAGFTPGLVAPSEQERLLGYGIGITTWSSASRQEQRTSSRRTASRCAGARRQGGTLPSRLCGGAGSRGLPGCLFATTSTGGPPARAARRGAPVAPSQSEWPPSPLSAGRDDRAVHRPAARGRPCAWTCPPAWALARRARSAGSGQARRSRSWRSWPPVSCARRSRHAGKRRVIQEVGPNRSTRMRSAVIPHCSTSDVAASANPADPQT